MCLLLTSYEFPRGNGMGTGGLWRPRRPSPDALPDQSLPQAPSPTQAGTAFRRSNEPRCVRTVPPSLLTRGSYAPGRLESIAPMRTNIPRARVAIDTRGEW
jgi:hypothetical protein